MQLQIQIWKLRIVAKDILGARSIELSQCN